MSKTNAVAVIIHAISPGYGRKKVSSQVVRKKNTRGKETYVVPDVEIISQ